MLLSLSKSCSKRFLTLVPISDVNQATPCRRRRRRQRGGRRYLQQVEEVVLQLGLSLQDLVVQRWTTGRQYPQVGGVVVPPGSQWLLLLLIYTSPSTSLNPGSRKISTTPKANLAQPHRPPRQISTTNRCQTRPKRWPTWSPIVSKTWVHFPGIVSPRPHRTGVPAAPPRERMRKRTREQKKRRAQHLTTMMM